MRKNGEVERRKKEMGIVTKEGYERKREWAANRMAENRELTTLSEEQHDALEEADEQGLGYDEEGDKKRNEIFENVKWEAYGIFSNINEQIESFLLKIDRKHGTNYCPSGATRV